MTLALADIEFIKEASTSAVFGTEASSCLLGIQAERRLQTIPIFIPPRHRQNRDVSRTRFLNRFRTAAKNCQRCSNKTNAGHRWYPAKCRSHQMNRSRKYGDTKPWQNSMAFFRPVVTCRHCPPLSRNAQDFKRPHAAPPISNLIATTIFVGTKMQRSVLLRPQSYSIESDSQYYYFNKYPFVGRK